MSTADDYAKWIVANQDKKGTEDFNTVVAAYQEAKAEESQGGNKELTTAPPSLADPVARIAASSAVPYAVTGTPNMTNAPPPGIFPQPSTTGPVIPGTTKTPGAIPYVASDALNVAKTVSNNATINSALDVMKKHGLTGGVAELGKAIMHPFANTTLTQAAKNIGGGLAYGMAAPENAFSAPYQMAAYEQEKIRANPNAPEYANNPYAMQQRGQAPTQGAAGAMNQRRAVVGQQYGGISAEDQARLEDDQMKRMIRYAALKKALGQ